MLLLVTLSQAKGALGGIVIAVNHTAGQALQIGEVMPGSSKGAPCGTDRWQAA